MRVLNSLILILAAAGAAPAAETSPADRCAAIAGYSYETVADHPAVVRNARYVTDAVEALEVRFMFGKRSIVQGMNVGEDVRELPGHCRIEGYVAPATRFLILLPDPSDWTGRVMYAACDAFCGALDEDMPVPGLLNGIATIATDGGHVNKRPFDGTWGYRNREGELAFGYKASHHAARVIKAVAEDYYGKPHTHSYITGFSKGGLAGVKAALMYPDDFDGVVSRSPVIRYQDINAVRLPYLYRSNTREDGSPILYGDDAMIVHEAVIAACDAVDGLADGIIDDPRKCDFDPSVLLCKKGEAGSCLSGEKVEVVRKFYALPTNDRGEVSYPYPLEYGSEYDWLGFHTPRSADGESYSGHIGRTFLRYLAFEEDPGATFDWEAFDPVANAHRLAAMKPVWDATDPDLRGFRNAGGKMIVVHGWGDDAVSARMTIDWFESVEAFMGDTSDFLQLYVPPGNKHGGSPGDGPNVNDSLDAVIDWVENGKTPGKLIFRLEDETGRTVRSRPGFPYPAVAVYKGSGSIDDAGSFEARVPGRE
ncbi:MAG: tannase/feruloyl esterase family alpha/beta hydrolase [Proteobacteria bacterium]|nr:tannase/feruloyl esterase family alpha/beta hydrolase [Pseudomonadota bacterium]